ncbi:staphyloferrin B biosynthesis decarboxylase SbnH [Prauserella halophila]|uniref:Staphyloferrin B biosynthesis decarboxylase SbnH n=1 Tax=Prauserella halophila TaxID=185641 RepID=A0ABN1W6I6_9PSEU|nr:type III PLP-dependent enzyme [Prauserella halophila]MCP2235557.1 diaminopimelate decarboxylase [Prauserella halophila]
MTAPEPACRYVYDLGGLAAHVRDVVAALPQRCRMFYAMKANSAPEILRTLAPLVDGFEVASGGEFAKARAVGDDVPVVFGGPAKTPTELADALAGDVLRFHAESVLELHRMSRVAAAAGRTADVLLRVNLADALPAATIAMAGAPTQFGIEEARLGQAMRTVRELPGVRFAGFHLHSLSNNLSPAAHLAMLRLYRDKILDWEREFGVACDVVNVGGGIGVNYAPPENTPQPGDITQPGNTTQPDDTAQSDNTAQSGLPGMVGPQFDWPAFTTELSRLVDTFPSHWREVDFECGRFLVAACGTYETEVLDVKRNHGTHFVLVRGGTHHFRLPSSWQHSHPFRVRPADDWPPDLPRPEAAGTPVTIVGELCTPKDVLARDVVVDRVRAGDVLEFRYAGAYGWEISHHDFLSHPHPEHVFR